MIENSVIIKHIQQFIKFSQKGKTWKKVNSKLE